MSLFRKPKKIQRRVFCADDDDDGDPEPPPPPIISQKKENKPVKNTTLLSFADEEDDGEVFKVKKSSQSKKLAKRREKEKRRVPDGDNNKYDNNSPEDTMDNEDMEEKPKVKKKVSLEGLILSGREALAADGAGDLSDDEMEAEEDSRGFHLYRAESVRAALAQPGHIPDAALIHAARKTRQQARELGDFVPIRSEAAPGSRLIRDDGSGDDDDEDGRIEVCGLVLPSDKPKQLLLSPPGGTAAASEEELDSEAEEWEKQQIQKAMPANIDITGDGNTELNPFAVVPPAPQVSDTSHLRTLLTADKTAPTTAQQLLEALTSRLEELQAERSVTASKREEVQTRLLLAARMRESRAARRNHLDAAYRRAQAARGYITDLVECLDEKMPQLEALEARALQLHRRRCEFLVERRRADVRDQAQDVLALAARPGVAKPVDSEEKTRRAAEREGRRRARRMRREAVAAAAGAGVPAHRDGDSSDDDLPPTEQQHFTLEIEAIRQLSSQVFADALPAWRSVRGVCARVSRWRRSQPALYNDAYVADCLPRLLAPYIRHELILWNPLADEDNEDYEKMDWYKCLMMYGVRAERLSSDSELSSEEEAGPGTVLGAGLSEAALRDDPDLLLVPTLINKVVLPKVTELVEQAWDPMCVRACVRLRRVLERACALPGGPALRRLATAARARLAAALHADVFLPALPPHVLEGAGGAFWRRCVGAGVRLLRAALALSAPPPTLNADALVLSLIETLCCAAGAAPGVQAAAAGAALADTLPRSGPLRTHALRRLARLAQLALTRLQSDNPMHMKALEQARNILSEAHAAE
ncbi:GC-rich sequence DNA-binding factor 1 [Papilio xuthus]|uniref:GC-rich sequence DNA-binding factor 1 n=1 Tax=Papilio xuthus TaxID=66420 RepID=A0A194PKT5_PAPXU|nr:GC-rich sequence DNA-binding factor 1 [Papilio xuthus]